MHSNRSVPANEPLEYPVELGHGLAGFQCEASRILGLAASAGGRHFAWLDGGDDGNSWLAVDPDHIEEGNDLAVLDRVDASWRADPRRVWIGWIGYDVGSAAMLGRARPRASTVTGIVMRRYPAALESVAGRVVGHGDRARCVRLANEVAIASSLTCDRWPLTALQPTIEAATYRDRVELAKRHIVAGETYQVNLSQAFRAQWNGHVRGLSLRDRVASTYAQLRGLAPASMGALIDADTCWICSNSPETLLDVRLSQRGCDTARSVPIKGTRARVGVAEDDAIVRRQLLAAVKDRAEHVMIVDLVRNDLGRLAVPGSVRASEPELLTLPTVHHLVSEVRCELRKGWRLRELFESIFPGGSVTGAPKVRTVQIIDGLEQEARGIYCGAIVVLEPTGLRASIPIRTGILDGDGLMVRGGGGIVMDSDAEEERMETVAKVRAFDPEG